MSVKQADWKEKLANREQMLKGGSDKSAWKNHFLATSQLSKFYFDFVRKMLTIADVARTEVESNAKTVSKLWNKNVNEWQRASDFQLDWWHPLGNSRHFLSVSPYKTFSPNKMGLICLAWETRYVCAQQVLVSSCEEKNSWSVNFVSYLFTSSRIILLALDTLCGFRPQWFHFSPHAWSHPSSPAETN